MRNSARPAPSGPELGYARVSTTRQSLDRQLDEDDDVTIRIRVDGGPMPGGMLDQMMREQGVRVVSRSSAKEERDWESAMGAAAAITTVVAEGGRPAIRAALALFRKRFPKAKIEVDGEPDDGGFLPDE